MRGAINHSTEARWGRVKVSSYKIKGGNLEKFGSDVFLAGQPAIPILDANPTPCQTLLKFYRAAWPLIITVVVSPRRRHVVAYL